ncbi:unnamed protein product [Rhizophagus irregularis]|nr:unnamed protein product [Rhizophagus irregularis]
MRLNELNELKVFYKIYTDDIVGGGFNSVYFGITQDPITKDTMLIMQYYELECWHSDPNKRPTVEAIYTIVDNMNSGNKSNKHDNIKVIKSSDIGPVTMNNPGAIYKSRPLSHMIKSATSRSKSIDPFYYYQKNSKASTGKRKFDEDSVEDSNNDQSIKKRRLVENFENKNSGYFTKEIELDINIDLNQPQNNVL